MTAAQLAKIGRPTFRRKFTADQLWTAALSYFKWCQDNPFMRAELVKYQGYAEEYLTPVTRPYSLNGLCAFLGVSVMYFHGLRNEIAEKIEAGKALDEEVELLEMVRYLETIIQAQQLEGAMANIFNAYLVGKINGLNDTYNFNLPATPAVHLSVRDNDTAANLNALDNIL